MLYCEQLLTRDKLKSTMAQALLEVNDLRKTYAGGFEAVKGVSFSVKKGEVFGILGPNGAGKTTTLEMIEGMRPITSGTAILDGIDVQKDTYAVKERIGIQLQSSSFFQNLNLLELLKLFNDLYLESADPMTLLKEVGLEEKAKAQVKELSGGQKQRFSIATTLVNNPVAIFLDEPTTGLDPQARRNLWDLVQQIQKKGTTVIITTHYMEEAQILCDRVAIMDEGKIIALDTPDQLIQALLKRGFKPQTKVAPATLEDVFIDLTGKDLRD
ncbi:MAG: transporter ATP-binding protein [Patescibacteria group bacterium]|nr:transporter ATP-binding protein [Patescibacteria group bacterium]